MLQQHHRLKNSILHIVDFFYPPFRKIVPLQTFRYAACGGANTALDILLFFISYNFILHKKLLHLGLVTLSPHIAAFGMAFCISFPSGFYLSRYVVWQQTGTRKRIQLFRYFLVVMVCIAMNYFLLKLFVDHWHWYPTPSKMIISVIVVAFSYFSQRHFSFRK